MSTKNRELKELHQLLGKVIDDLVERQEESEDPETIRALSREIREVAFRMTNVQQLLFKQQTQAIDAAVAKVKAGQAELTKAIAEIDKLNKFIKTISSFLALVDKVIDMAKLI